MKLSTPQDAERQGTAQIDTLGCRASKAARTTPVPDLTSFAGVQVNPQVLLLIYVRQYRTVCARKIDIASRLGHSKTLEGNNKSVQNTKQLL
jgi:hypothetical protein